MIANHFWCGFSIPFSVFDVIVEYCLTLGVCIKVGCRDRDILWCGFSILVSVFDVIVESCLTPGVRVLRLVQYERVAW